MYEQAGAQGRPGPGAGGSPFGWNVNTGGGRSGVHTMTEDEMRDMFGESSPFSDFFQTFFGGAYDADAGSARSARGGRARAREGRDVEQEIELPLEDAFTGTTRRFGISMDG